MLTDDQPLGDRDNAFATLHEQILNGDTADIEEVPRSNGIVLSFGLLEGNMSKLDEEIHHNKALFETMTHAPRTRR